MSFTSTQVVSRQRAAVAYTGCVSKLSMPSLHDDFKDYELIAACFESSTDSSAFTIEHAAVSGYQTSDFCMCEDLVDEVFPKEEARSADEELDYCLLCNKAL